MLPLTYDFDSCTKRELMRLADRLLEADFLAIEWCVAFIEAESYGLWHGRARAKMSRRLKHVSLSKQQRSRLVQAILNRLVTGRFSEQFKDQLQLALQFNPKLSRTIALECQNSEKDYIRRYAEWALTRKAAMIDEAPDSARQ